MSIAKLRAQLLIVSQFQSCIEYLNPTYVLIYRLDLYNLYLIG